MTFRRGEVRADGTSTIMPAGVYDMTTAAQEPIHPELEKQLAKTLATLDSRETKARFKLEVFFRGGPRKSIPVRGVVSCWTNGGFLHGGGDSSVYFCPQKMDEAGTICLEPIDLQFAAAGRVVCTRCRRISKTDDLVGQLLYEVSTQRWAEILVHLFHRLNCDADLRIGIERRSLRLATIAETSRNREGDEYAKVEGKREWITYPLANIIKDTSSGAGLETRFRAFLEA